MMNVNNWDSSFAIDKSTLKKRKRQKARLPVIQRLSFSVGNFLNDAVAGAWASYLIIFQTKVLGMSNRGVGILSIAVFIVDAVVSLFVGYVCDNVKFPFCAERYGKRKSFHLLGTILVAGFFPLLMMPCFICGSDSSEWKMLVYYGIIMITHNIGWALAQITHLALIPETAKRPREMVELHALRSGITFFSGIFTYVVTWILLKTDGRDESISASNWRDFMEMVIIVVSTGCFFSIIFHLGTKEPPAKMRNKKEESLGREREGNPIAELPLPEKVVGVFCLYNDNDCNAAVSKAYNTELDSSLEDIEQNVTPEDTVVVNKAVDNSTDISLNNSGTGFQFIDEGKSEFSFSNPGFKTAEELFSGGEKSPDEEIAISECCTKRSDMDEFTFSNLAFICEDKQSAQDDNSRPYENSTMADSQNDILMEDRQSNRLDSDISEGYASSPETDSVGSTEIQELEDYNKEPEIQVGLRAAPFQPSRKSSFTKGTDASFAGVDEIVIVDKHDKTIWKTSKSWIDWFKNPMFYKVSFAYTVSRLIQVYSPSYAPMYLMDTLGFEKESIAYFPLVILMSGVFSSLGAKTLDKILGAKWTYCLAASSVIGASAWFYFQTPSGRNAAYFAAILMGFGGSVMYVTSTALAGELIGESKESGAFVFASMGSLGKVACGGAFFFTQEFFPTNGSTSEYIRYVFSVVPGAASILAFLVVIAFLPATVRCRKVVHTTDAIVQTEDVNVNDIIDHNQMVLCDECQKKETVIDIRSTKARVVS